MRKILMSLFTIAIVGTIIGGGVVALFSDVETSSTNVFQTGTVDIAIDGENPWSGSFTLEDMKPCETGYICFIIENVGQNKAAIFKHIKDVVCSGGEAVYPVSDPVCSSEPEYVEGGGASYVEKCDIDTVIDYDLKVKLYDADGNFQFEHVIYEEGVNTPPISEIKCQPRGLPILPPGWKMVVEQSYHMRADTTNWAQGDRMEFTIEVSAQQLTGHLHLENKDPNGWYIVQDDRWGRLMYLEVCPIFYYEFHGYDLEDIEYSLIYYADPWPGNNPGALIASGTASGGELHLEGVIELNMDLPHPSDANYPGGAKIWLVPSADYGPNGDFCGGTVWNPDDYLFETHLITYDDIEVP